MKYLYAAYIAIWAIHIVYLLTLNARVRQVQKQAEELERPR
jgi:CcmD family protein